MFIKPSPETEYTNQTRILTIGFEYDVSTIPYMRRLTDFARSRAKDTKMWSLPRSVNLLPGFYVDHVVAITNISIEEAQFLSRDSRLPQKASVSFLIKIPKEE